MSSPGASTCTAVRRSRSCRSKAHASSCACGSSPALRANPGVESRAGASAFRCSTDGDLMDASALIMFFFVLVMLIIGSSFFLWLIPIQLWIAAWSSGTYVGLMTLIAMRLRRVSPQGIVNPRITAMKAGLDIPVDLLESHYLAGGNVVRVVNALIS